MDNEEKRRYVADAANEIRTKLDLDPDATRLRTALSYLLDEPSEHGAGYLADELWTQRMRHDAVKRKNASLEAELETRKKREILLLELLKHERENSRPPARKPRKTTPSDLKRVQTAFANLSREDVVRAVRSARDAR